MKLKTISEELKNRYGKKILKLSLSSGCTCPNRDGTAGWGGCSFCSEGGSGEFAADFAPLEEQIAQAKRLTDKKFPSSMPASQRQYIAYFQSFSNTYGSAGRLESLYRQVIERDDIVILSIGTRPDCLPDEIIEMLSRLNRIKPVWVELGLQTVHDRTAKSFGRGYDLSVFEDAYGRLSAAGIETIIHMILGLPVESREDMLASIRYLTALDPVPGGIKLQNLQILKGTRMEEMFLNHPFPLMTMDEYTDLIVDCVKLLPPAMIIHRMTGDPPRKLLVAPKWCTDKKRVLNTLHRKLSALPDAEVTL